MKLMATLLVLLTAGCATVPPENEKFIIRIIHVEASDGPTAWGLTVHGDGTLILEKLGRRRQREGISQQAVQDLRALIEDEEFSRAPPSERKWSHQELIQIEEADGTIRIFTADNPPAAILPTLRLVDSMFSEAFGGTYNWTLLVSKEGPY